MKEKVLRVILVMLLIMTLTMANVIVAGIGIVSYAIDGILADTSHKNVEFMAYFKNGEEKIASKEESIANEDIRLYMSISVKNEGYFNGEIEVLDSNFKLKEDKLTDRINKIEGNKVILNQINAGEIVEIEVAVTPIKDDILDINLLNKETTLKLAGTYKDSTQKDITVNAEKKVCLVLEPEENVNVILNSEILTNKVYQINEENKKLVQVLVESGLENNNYPVKSTEIEVAVPENVEDVKVFSRGTIATNGKSETEFTEANYEYVKEQNKVIIKVQNDEQDGKINWSKSGRDVFVITYILSKDANVLNEQIDIKGKIELYNSKNTVFNRENAVKIEEEKDGIVNYSIIIEESSIYKGKIYSGEDREYKTDTNIYINNSDIVNKVVAREEQSTFVANEKEGLANTQYKETRINKQQMLDILGKDGEIRILDNNSNVIIEINNQTQEDENGEIVVEYQDGITSIVIEISKPEKTGIIEIESTKVIKSAGYKREQIKSITGLKEKISANYNEVQAVSIEKVIELKETSTQATLNINKNSLSTMEENQNVQIEIKLNNNNESQDLFKNPVVRLELPSQIESVNINSINLLYESELIIKSAKLYEGNIIEIELQGEQTAYRSDEVINGATIIINADVTVNKKVASSDEKIRMLYTNENAITYNAGEQGIEEIGISIVAPRELVTINSVDENVVIGESETKEAKLEIASEAKNSEVAIEVLNNNTNMIEDVKILGRFPTKGTVQLDNEQKENTIDIVVTTAIKASGIDESRIKVYYSENENASIDDSSWTEEFVNGQTVKSYLIIIDNMGAGEGISFGYGIYIPENLSYNQVAFENYSVTYTDVESVNETTVSATAIALASEIDENVAISAISEKQDIQVTIQSASEDYKVQIGKSNKYIVKIVNNTSEDKNNIQVAIKNDGSVGEILFDDFDDNASGTIETLKAGEEKQLLVYIQPNSETKKTNMTISVEVKDGDKTYTSNELVKEIINPRVQIELTSENESGKVRNNESIQYDVKITNVGNVDINAMTIRDTLSPYFTLESIKQNGVDIEYTQISNDISFKIGLNKAETTTINIKVKLSDFMSVDPRYVTNKITGTLDTKEIGVSNEVKHILVPDGMTDEDVDVFLDLEEDDEDTDDDIEYEEDDSDGDTDDDDDDDDDEDGYDDEESEFHKISGKAWLDENKDGKKDTNEKLLSGINVKLLNIETGKIAKYNDQDIIATTDEDGYYKLQNIEKGKYLVLFEYDTSKYSVTEYMSSGVSETNNSNVIVKSITVDGNSKIYAITDTIEISEKSISNINMGLIEIETFDLELDKYVSRVVVQNNNGTKEYNYDEANLAKIEIAAKQLKNTIVVVEYTIKLTNNGEVDGYVKSIVDYLPTDFKFSSELNNDWYQLDGYLYNKSLANNKIRVGETKEIKLILTKTMTESNTGLINNTAEIAECYNDLGTTDIDSTPFNKASGEDDMGSADLIISVKTGEILVFIGLIIGVLVVFVIGAYCIYIKFYGKEVKDEKRNS